MSMHSHIDFAYPWYLSYGHLLLATTGLALCTLIWFLKWSRLALIPVAAFTLWAASASVMVFTGLNLNTPMELPTSNFLKSGTPAKVLDMGAGTGRSTIMVLDNRPKTTVVALDLFTEQYEMHFGKLNGQEKLLANLKAAGVDERATIQQGDMRKLPFPDATFDGIVSSYAIDHLARDGVKVALHEASRVLKPGGEFLMAVIAKDGWLTYTFGPLLVHAGTRTSSYWPEAFKESGFEMIEQGHRPATAFYLVRKPTIP